MVARVIWGWNSMRRNSHYPETSSKPVMSLANRHTPLRCSVHDRQPCPPAPKSPMSNAILDGSGIVMLSGETATMISGGNRADDESHRHYSEKFVHKPSTFVAGLGVERAICNSVKDLMNLPGQQNCHRDPAWAYRPSDLCASNPKSRPHCQRRRFVTPSVLWCPSGYIPD